MFEDAPAALNRIVLAVIWRVISELHRNAILTDEVDDSSHELGAPTMIFWTVAQVELERGDSWKTVTDSFPTLAETINQTIARHLGGDCIDEQLCAARE